MAKRCYYDVLGVERGADDGDIKTAFRRLAKECHPDRCNGDPTAETAFQGSQRSLRGVEGPAAPRRL